MTSMLTRNRHIQVTMQQRAAQAAPAAISLNVVCPCCGQTTRVNIHPDFIMTVDEDGMECGTRCVWCRKSFNIVTFTEKQRKQ